MLSRRPTTITIEFPFQPSTNMGTQPSSGLLTPPPTPCRARNVQHVENYGKKVVHFADDNEIIPARNIEPVKPKANTKKVTFACDDEVLMPRLLTNSDVDFEKDVKSKKNAKRVRFATDDEICFETEWVGDWLPSRSEKFVDVWEDEVDKKKKKKKSKKYGNLPPLKSEKFVKGTKFGRMSPLDSVKFVSLKGRYQRSSRFGFWKVARV